MLLLSVRQLNQTYVSGFLRDSTTGTMIPKARLSTLQPINYCVGPAKAQRLTLSLMRHWHVSQCALVWISKPLLG